MSTGILYLCATPIGNLEDITLRALRILREVNLIAAEDTRRTVKLLNYYGIHTPLTSFHRHNYRRKGAFLLDVLLKGQKIALVSDAGLPGIADPGEEMVLLAVAHEVPVVPVPGSNAALAALIASGLPAKCFCFEGFLPSTTKARQEKLRQLRGEKRTLIFYEAPHRLQKTLADMLILLEEDRKIVIARELTKLHEEIWRGTVAQAITYFDSFKPRGEFTLVVAGNTQTNSSSCLININDRGVEENILIQVKQLENKGLTRQEAIRQIARQFNLPKRKIYALTVKDKK